MARIDIKPLPTVERLRELFVYDAETGDLRWKSIPRNFNRAKVGDIVGTIRSGSHRYRVVGVDRQYYYVHRIIWKMVTGTDPEDQIDHIDNNQQNNKWANIRPADNEKNMYNRKIGKNNRSGVKGVCWAPTHKSWIAYITSDRIQKKLGRFKSLDAAKKVRQTAALRLHGEFVRL